jgi:hypothetical protein
MYICETCSKQFDNKRSIGNHRPICKKEKLKAQDYYKDPKKCIKCNNIIPYEKRKRNYCNLKCSNSCEIKKELTRNSCVAKYGVDNPAKSQKIKDITENNNIIKYGIKSPAQLPNMRKLISTIAKNNYKERISKAIKTNLLKYGTEYYFESKEFKQKYKELFISKYGVENVSQLDFVKAKKKETSIKNYGVDHYSKTIKGRQELSDKLRGIPKSDNTKQKIREKALIRFIDPTKHPSWQGGISFEPYCIQWTDREYKNYLLYERDGKCFGPECNGKHIHKLLLHHINYDKKDCRPSNLIGVCVSCNSKANKDREWHEAWYTTLMIKRDLINK